MIGLWCLLSNEFSFAQARYLLTAEQPGVLHRAQRTWVQPLEFGRVLTAVLLQDRSAVELLTIDACDAVMSRRRIRVSGVSGLFGFERLPEGHFLVGAQLADGLGALLLRITPEADVVWAYRYRLTQPVQFGSLDVYAQGDALLAGSASGGGAVFAMKVSAAGGVAWARRVEAPVSGLSRACALRSGGAFQVGDNLAWKWTSLGALEWHARAQTRGYLMPDNIRPVEVSDGYVFAVRMEVPNMHLAKVSPDGQVPWHMPYGFPIAHAGTMAIINKTDVQKLLRYRGDTIVVGGFAGGFAALHFIGPSGDVLLQRYYTSSALLNVQDFCTASGRVHLAGWHQTETLLMGLKGDMHLGCGDTTYPTPNTFPLRRLSFRPEPLPNTETVAVTREAFSAATEALTPTPAHYLCIDNDSTGMQEVVCIRRPTCLGEVVYLRPEAPDGAAITWHDGRHDTLFRAEGPGTYIAQIAYCGLRWTVEYRLEAHDCACEPIFSTAFTPDGDGVNDIFSPIAVLECAYAAFEWAVFNRWGERLFTASNPTDAWNGRRPDGQVAPSDVYVWQLRYALPNGAERVWFVKKGDVTLVR